MTILHVARENRLCHSTGAGRMSMLSKHVEQAYRLNEQVERACGEWTWEMKRALLLEALSIATDTSRRGPPKLLEKVGRERRRRTAQGNTVSETVKSGSTKLRVKLLEKHTGGFCSKF